MEGENRAAGAHEDKCPMVTGNTAMWAAEILMAKMKKASSSEPPAS